MNLRSVRSKEISRHGFILSVLTSVFLAPTAAMAGDLYAAPDLYTAPAPVTFDQRWGAWGEIGGTYGTEESSYGDIAIFLPLAQTPDSLFFTELRGKYFEGNLLEGNAMLGYRKMTASGFNLGIWGGLDGLHTDSDNSFGQVSGGLEALSQYFDARVNGYYPFSDPQAVSGAEVVLEGDNIFMIGGQEVALYGVDGEIGARLPLGSGNHATLGVYGGGYWFDSDDIDEAVAGGMARVELAWNDVIGPGSQISAQYKYTNDNVRGARNLIGARLRIPLGPAPAASTVSPQRLRMADRIERDVEIVVAPSGKEAVEDAITDVAFDQALQVGTDADLAAALASGPNTLIILDDMGSDYAGNLAVGPFQTLQGGGSTIAVRGLESGTVADFTAPGSRPTINRSDGVSFPDSAPVLTVDDRTHLAGLDITGGGGKETFLNGNDGIAYAGGTFVALTDINVSQIGRYAIDFRDAVGVRAIFDNVDVWDTQTYGFIFFNADNAVLDFRDVTVSDVKGTGIQLLGASNAHVDFTDVMVSNIGSLGMDLGFTDGAQFDFTNVTVQDTGRQGIDFRAAEDVTVNFLNVNVLRTSGAFGAGIRFNDADGAHVTFTHVTVDDTNDAGIDFRDAGNSDTRDFRHTHTVVVDHELVDLQDEAELRCWEMMDGVFQLRMQMLRCARDTENTTLDGLTKSSTTRRPCPRSRGKRAPATSRISGTTFSPCMSSPPGARLRSSSAMPACRSLGRRRRNCWPRRGRSSGCRSSTPASPR
jgi:hypothetical protein